MKLYGTSALDEEHPQIATTMLSDAAKYGAITSRHLPRYQAQPGGKVPPFCKGSSIADRSNHPLAMMGPKPGIVIRRPQFTSVSAKPSISVTVSIRSSRCISDDFDHAGR
jgi:hypothetical protein